LTDKQVAVRSHVEMNLIKKRCGAMGSFQLVTFICC